MLIVGIDIAKRKHEATIINSSGDIIGKSFAFDNSTAGATFLLEKINTMNTNNEPIAFGMEATGHYWLALYSRLLDDGFTVHVINPIQSDALRNLYIRKTKNDSKDSFIVAETIRFGRFSETVLADSDLLALRQLCRFRMSQVDSIASLKKQAIAVIDQVFPEYEKLFSDIFGKSSIDLLSEAATPEEILAINTDTLASLLNKSSHGRFGNNKAIEVKEAAKTSFGIKLASNAFSFQIRQIIQQIKFCESQLDVLDDEIAELYKSFNSTVDTITGIGPVIGAVIISEIGDIRRFSEPAKLVAFSGIDPTVKQSGEFTGSKNHMSKRGSPFLRRAIWQAAFVASNRDPVLSAFYQKKRAEGKAHRTAIGAVCRKLLYIIYSIMRSNAIYTPIA